MFREYRKYLLVLLGLIILNLAFFAINLNNFFVSDDFDWLQLTKNSSHQIYEYFNSNYYGEQGTGGSYRPMVNVSFWLNYHLFGLNPLPYHLTNLFWHIGVCFLIYLLVLRLFAEYGEKNKIALLSALFFSLLPNHSEAVIWIAAVADPMATFFYLLAFYLYILFRQDKKFVPLSVSVAAFSVALLTKELAITLPLLILVWELYEVISKNTFKLKDVFLNALGYWLILALYFWLRFVAIGLFFGNYVNEKIKLDPLKIYQMFVALVTDLPTYGKSRVFLTDYFVTNKLFFIFLFILLLTICWVILRKYRFKLPFLFDMFFVLILPVVVLNFNNLSDEGERYNYLPSVVICIVLALLICQINKKVARNSVLIVVMIYFSTFLTYKNYTWLVAANLTKNIILHDFPQAVDLSAPAQDLIFLSLPDNLAGAQVLRNGIKQAVALYYPDMQANLDLVPAYVRLSLKNYEQKVLYWGPYVTGGYLAETYDQGPWVTGFDRKETAGYVFELWGYDYTNYTSSKLRFYLLGDYLAKQKENNFKILIFNQGRLQELKTK